MTDTNERKPRAMSVRERRKAELRRMEAVVQTARQALSPAERTLADLLTEERLAHKAARLRIRELEQRLMQLQLRDEP